MTRTLADAIAFFLWSQLNLDPEETIGHAHLTRTKFSDQVVAIDRRLQAAESDHELWRHSDDVPHDRRCACCL